MRSLALILAALSGFGCGYHVAGKSDVMPQTIQTIAVAPFGNRTIKYQLARDLPADISREFIERTRYKIVTDPRTADAVLTGDVVNFYSGAIVVDQVSGRATVMQASAFLKVTLTERTTGKVLFSRPLFEARERYEISVSPQTYFDEGGAGMARMAQDVARDVVTSILENF
ncbi:MAG: LPS assembly lipoprotein LptE [Bryobacteraceae bacterium]|jgi:RNase P/RNase MRP subunit p29